MDYYVTVTEDATGEVVQRMGPMHERKAEMCLAGLMRQMNHGAYSAEMVPAHPTGHGAQEGGNE